MGLSEAEKEAGYKLAPLPSDHVTAILRRVARGTINVTLTEEGPEYRYDDGTLVTSRKGAPLGASAFGRMVREGWLLPVEGGSFLVDGPPQQYRARTPADGKVDRIWKK